MIKIPAMSCDRSVCVKLFINSIKVVYELDCVVNIVRNSMVSPSQILKLINSQALFLS